MISVEIADMRKLGNLPAGIPDDRLAPHLASAVARVVGYFGGSCKVPTRKLEAERVREAAACFAIAYALPVLNTFYLSQADRVPRTIAETDYVFHEPGEMLKLVAYWEKRGYDILRDVGRTTGRVGVTVI